MSLKFLSLLILGTFATGVASTGCVRDKCFQQVRHNRFVPLKSKFKECQSFLASTVTPPIVTVTATSGQKSAKTTPAPCPTTTAAPKAVPGYASSCPNRSAFQSACSCLGFKAHTKTLKACTTTVTPSSPSATSITPPPSCDNQGLEWAYFKYTGQYTGQVGWPEYDPTFTYEANPDYTGVVVAVNPFSFSTDKAPVNLYNQYTGAADFYVLNHQGYIVAPMTGTYTFQVSQTDDVFDLWLGSDAYDNWTRKNSVMEVISRDSSSPAAQYTMQMTAGAYYAIRYTLAQAKNASALSLSIIGPDESRLFGPGTSSPFLVRYDCAEDDDVDTAPQFVPFGYNYQRLSGHCELLQGCLDNSYQCISPGCYGQSGCVALGTNGCNTPIASPFFGSSS